VSARPITLGANVKRAGVLLCLGLVVSICVGAQTAPPDAPKEHQSELKQFFSFSPPLSLAQDTRPMTVGKKFELFARNTVNPFQFVATAAWAGIAQAMDRYPDWGQGAEGYGKRYGAEYANMATSNFFGTFVFPAILKQDPRYFRKETGGFWNRVGYSLSRTAITRTDKGTNAPNVSIWMGALTAGALSNAWYPPSDQGVGQTFRNTGINLATTAGFNIAREFWPDVSRKLFHHKK